MKSETTLANNAVLLKGAALWLLLALVLAWCLVFLKMDVGLFKAMFPGEFNRLLQAHLDLLLMSALLFGFYAARIPLHRSVCWAMAVGAFTNSSLFLLMSVFPSLDGPAPEHVLMSLLFRLYMMASIVLTSFGFGAAAMTLLRSTSEPKS